VHSGCHVRSAADIQAFDVFRQAGLKKLNPYSARLWKADNVSWAQITVYRNGCCEKEVITAAQKTSPQNHSWGRALGALDADGRVGGDVYAVPSAVRVLAGESPTSTTTGCSLPSSTR